MKSEANENQNGKPPTPCMYSTGNDVYSNDDDADVDGDDNLNIKHFF